MDYREPIPRIDGNEKERSGKVVMQSVTLWVIWVTVFVLVFSAVALSVRGFLGVAWGVLIGAIVAMIITAGVGWCCLPSNCYRDHGISCLGFVAIILLIIGIILVIVAYAMRRRHKNKIKSIEEECCDDKSIQDELECHPDSDKKTNGNNKKTNGNGNGSTKDKHSDKVKEKHVSKSQELCGPDGNCVTKRETLDSLSRRSSNAQRNKRSLY